MSNINEYNAPNKNNYAFNIRDDKTIYLAIKTNIICVDDRLEIKYLNSDLNDFTATLYIGKIIFKKSKQNSLSPTFIPSKITDSSFEKLNAFWLNEINLNAKKPLKSIIQCSGISMPICEGVADSIPYQKIYYFRHKDNIVLTKEQIISYFTELHRLNIKFIIKYIDSINANRGIKAYYLSDRIYNELLKKGIINEIMIERYSNGKIKQNNKIDLIALDYLKQQESNHKMLYKILLHDELFYPYLVWSLRNFLAPYFIGRFQDENNIVFNAGAYKQYAGIHKIINPYKDEFVALYMDIFYDNISPTKYNVGYIEGYEQFFCYYGPNFSPTNERYLRLNLPTSKGYKQISPNQTINEIPEHELIWMTKEEQKPYNISISSPLGNYYFELDDNKGTYVEFFPRIYPSIDNPPKYWSKEMIKKLDLRLE